MSARRIAFRLALRRVRKDWRRSAAILTALTVPLAVATALAALNATSERSPESQVSSMIGQSRVVLRNAPLVAEAGATGALTRGPAEARAAAGRDIPMDPEVMGRLPVTAGGRQADTFGYGLDLSRPVHAGRFEFLDGRAPATDGEVALSASAADRLGVGVGEQVTFEGGGSATITGVAAIVTDTLRLFVITRPELAARTIAPATGQAAGAEATNGANVVWYVPEEIDTKALVADHWRAQHRAEAYHEEEPSSILQPSEGATLVLAIAILVVAELALIIGAVYVIVVRSNRRELALLAAAGAGPRTRRAVIGYQGLLIGVVAAVLGGVLGTALAWLARPWAAAQRNEIWEPLRIDPLALGVLALVGVVTPAVAAILAARGVRFDVVAALNDQEETARSGGRPATAYVGMTVAGVLLLLGGVFVQSAAVVALGALALVAAAGAVLRRLLPGLRRRSGPVSLVQRIALRITANAAGRAATLGVVTGSLLVLSGLVLAGEGGLARQAQDRYVPATPDGAAFIETTKAPGEATVGALAEAFGVGRVVRLGIAAPPPPPVEAGGDPLTFWGNYQAAAPIDACLNGGTVDDCVRSTGYPAGITPVMLTTPEDFAAVTGVSSAAARAALTSGRAVVLDDRLAPGGKVSLRAPQPSGSAQTRELDAVVAAPRSRFSSVPMVYIGDSGLTALGGVRQPNSSYFYVPKPAGEITAEREDRARGILSGDIGAGYFSLTVERGPEAVRVLEKITWSTIVLMALISAALAFITVALAVQEIRPDLSALAATGADRRFRSLLSGLHAGQVSLLGTLAGLAVTVVSVPALLAVMGVGWSVWPWVGLLAAAAAGVGSAVLAGWFGGSRVTTILRRVR